MSCLLFLLKTIPGALCTVNFELFLQKQSINFSFFAAVFLLEGITLLKCNCQAGLAHLPHAVCVGCSSGSALGAPRQRRG